MATGVNNFRQNFFGHRPNRFTVNGSFPTGVLQDNTSTAAPTAANAGGLQFDIYCKATSIPGSSIGVIPVAWQGRIVKFSGERTYADWSIQIYDSSIASQKLRILFEEWINKMNHRDQHILDYSLTSDWTVSFNDVVRSVGASPQNGHTERYIMRNCFPIDISPMDMSYDMTDTFAELTVTMAYDFWEPQNVGSQGAS